MLTCGGNNAVLWIMGIPDGSDILLPDSAGYFPTVGLAKLYSSCNTVAKKVHISVCVCEMGTRGYFDTKSVTAAAV